MHVLIGKMKKYIGYIVLFLMMHTSAWATHNRAGQIVYKHISGNTYEFTITTFTYSLSAADRNEINVTWGDNTYSVAPRIEKLPLADNYNKNTYVIRHTFPGAGVYSIVMEDPNRNLGVVNIPNSVSVVFSVKTIFRIDPNLGANNAPQLLTYPIDKAALGQVFIHNPSAYDIDGDSLSYELTTCTRERGVDIEDYTLPTASDSLVVNPITGDLIWASPVQVGIYNIAMKVDEWRKGVKIGSIARDMQIEVVDSKNRPPVISDVASRCVEAGTRIYFTVRATDPDNDQIKLSATGGPFQVSVSPSTFTVSSSGAGYAVAAFEWNTDQSHVRKQPYAVSIKAEDQNTEVKLVAFRNFNITVLAPKVTGLTSVASRKSVNLKWNTTICTQAAGYEIYRSIGNPAVNPDSCVGGIPAESGYEKIATIQGIGNTIYEDNNNGKGLSPGIEYCYRIVAYFSDGAKSFPSDASCAVLMSGTPPMIRAHVDAIDATNGIIDVAWLYKPLQDTLANHAGPFQYRLYTTTTPSDNNWTFLYQTPVPVAAALLTDTTFTDDHRDTKNIFPHYYKVELWNMSAGNEYRIDEFETASTLYPVLQPSDKSVIITFGRLTPWINAEYTIYRCISTNGMCIPVDSVGVSYNETYTDTGLKNGQSYCYRIRSRGYRLIDNVRYDNENYSHVACVMPEDNVPPCAPELSGKSICADNRNELTWTMALGCGDDVEKYYIYYSFDRRTYNKIDSVLDPHVMTYSHNGVVIGCYQVAAVDSAGNISPMSNILCLDECGTYELPNVFTPNGDNINDIFKAYNPGHVEKVDMKIYNRWGKLVFKTSDPNINWDGRDMTSKRFVLTGVYYYTCDVYEDRLTGTQMHTQSGFIHLYAGNDAQPFIE